VALPIYLQNFLHKYFGLSGKPRDVLIFGVYLF
jgi:hypothetical protein